jgi:anhydro-N-acetylmuramic acid kinase
MNVAAGKAVASGEISELNFVLGELFGEAALKVCRRAGISPKRLAAIGSHGQTIFHQGSTVRPRGQASTLQIAEPAVIAEKTGVSVVSNFRTADMAAGGEGAPLVPMVDFLLLRDARQGTVALNIGGIANFTVIPARARPQDVFGFDTGPGNMLIDGLVRHFSKGRKPFDADGRMASQGKLIQPLLEAMLHLDYFQRRPPKSAGREQFGAEFLQRYLLSRRNARPQDLVCTATELTARTISSAIESFVFPQARMHRLIISGGGAHNQWLIGRLKALLPQLSVYTSTEFGLPVDAKEAIAFAVLADRTLHGLPGNLPSVTGARKAAKLGTITVP